MQSSQQSELRLKIHQILNRCGFYRLPLLHLTSILQLLGAEEAHDAKAIQTNTIIGLIRLTNPQREAKANYFAQSDYPPETLEMQEYLSGILRVIISQRYHSQSCVEPRTGPQPVTYPFNPFGCVSYPASGRFPGASLFGGSEMGTQALPYGNAYMPYGNYSSPEMFYYHMYGAYQPPAKTQAPTGQLNILPEKGLQEKKDTNKDKKEEVAERQDLNAGQIEIKEQPFRIIPIPRKKKRREMAAKFEQKSQIRFDQAASLKKSKKMDGKKEKIERNVDFKMPEDSSQKRNELLDRIFSYNKKDETPKQLNQAKPPPTKNQKACKQVDQQYRLQLEEKEKDNGIVPALLTRPRRTPKVVQRFQQKIAQKAILRKQRKKASLELKYYNSITDFDYRVYPTPAPSTDIKPKPESPPAPPPSPPKRIAVSVETQTDLNLLINDFRILRHQQKEQAQEKGECRVQQELQNIQMEDNNSSSPKPSRGLDMASSEHQQEFHLGLEHDPLLQNHKSHIDQPSEAIELIPHQPMEQEQPQQPQEQEDEQDPQPSQQSHPSFRRQLANCLCAGTHEGETMPCVDCHDLYHPSCLRTQPCNNFSCPRCRIRMLNPSLQFKQVIGQYFLQNLAKTQFRTLVNLTHLDYMSNRRIQDRTEELQLRCVRVDEQDNGEVVWPDEAEVRVNGDKVTEFYQTVSLRRRKDTPLIITEKAFKLTSEMEDCGIAEIAIALKPSLQRVSSAKFPPNNTGLFLVGLYHTIRPPLSAVFERMLSKLPSQGEQFLLGLLSVQKDEDIRIEKQVFRLQDPYTKHLMRVPVRGISCEHGQCFDLRTFLALMSTLRRGAWRCPICSRDVRKLVRDQWMANLIQTTKGTPIAEVSYYGAQKVVLKTTPVYEEDEEDSQQRRKEKKIKKKAKPVGSLAVKRDYQDQPIRTNEGSDHSDIDRYLATEVLRRGKAHKL